MFSVNNKYLTIRGDEKFAPYAYEILEKVTQKFKGIKNFFKLEDLPKIDINLYDDKETMLAHLEDEGQTYEHYSKGSFTDQDVDILVDFELNDIAVLKVVNMIAHELSHLAYYHIYDGNFERPLWLDEGIAQYLSNERSGIQANEARFKSCFLENILNKYKEIPKIDYLKKEGTGKNTIGYHRYNGYTMSFFMFCYLLSHPHYRENLNLIIRDPERIENLEKKKIISQTVNYFGARFKLNIACSSFKSIKTPQDLMDYMDANLIYGWMDKRGIKHINSNKDLASLYKTNTLDQIINNSVGTCIEQAKLQQYVFEELGLKPHTFCHREKGSIHFFTTYESDGKFYYFEHARPQSRGIHEYASLEELLQDYHRFMTKEGSLIEIPYIPDDLTYKELMDFVDSIRLKKSEEDAIEMPKLRL